MPDIWESVTIAINRDCNIYCNFCPVKVDDKVLSLKKVKEVIKFYSSINKDWTIRIKLQGGEPILHWPLLSRIIKESNFPNIQFVITTNGLLLTNDKLNFFNVYNCG